MKLNELDTSDGISDNDWSAVEDLVLNIVNQSANGQDDQSFRLALLFKLESLEEQYGRLPSLLATQADFTDDRTQALVLLKEAYINAGKLNDYKNLSYVSASLSEFYAEDIVSYEKLCFWAEIFKTNLKQYEDDYLNELVTTINEYIEDCKPV